LKGVRSKTPGKAKVTKICINVKLWIRCTTLVLDKIRVLVVRELMRKGLKSVGFKFKYLIEDRWVERLKD